MKTYIIMALNTDNDKFVLEHAGMTPIKEYIGSYKGVEEKSYLLPANSDTISLARAFNQESIVKLNGNNATILDTISQRPLLQGEWLNVGTNKPDTDAWTYDIESGTYFIIK